MNAHELGSICNADTHIDAIAHLSVRRHRTSAKNEIRAYLGGTKITRQTNIGDLRRTPKFITHAHVARLFGIKQRASNLNREAGLDNHDAARSAFAIQDGKHARMEAAAVVQRGLVQATQCKGPAAQCDSTELAMKCPMRCNAADCAATKS